MKRSFDRLNEIGSQYLSLQSAFLLSTCEDTSRPTLLRSWLPINEPTIDTFVQLTSTDGGVIDFGHPNRGYVSSNGLRRHSADILGNSLSDSSEGTDKANVINVNEASMIEIQFSQTDEELRQFSSNLSWKVFRYVKGFHIARAMKEKSESQLSRRKILVRKGGRRLAAEAQEIGRSSAQPLISPQLVVEQEAKKARVIIDSEQVEVNGNVNLLGVEIVQR
jgi:hypothetical protein